jgi:hypothetical protein
MIEGASHAYGHRLRWSIAPVTTLRRATTLRIACRSPYLRALEHPSAGQPRSARSNTPNACERVARLLLRAALFRTNAPRYSRARGASHPVDAALGSSDPWVNAGSRHDVPPPMQAERPRAWLPP